MSIKPISDETVTLDWLKVRAQQAIPYAEVEIMQQRDFAAFYDQILVRIKAEILAEKLPPEKVTQTRTVTWTVPATWWDHFKQAHEGRWWARWFKPARTIERKQTAHFEVSLERYWAYPEARVIPDSFGSPVRVHQVSNRVWWE